MSPTKTLKVLIAEDDYLAREKIKELIETIGYTLVGEATNGQEAVEMASALAPDVILMDIQMPVMDGLEATRRIQSRSPVPVVVLSAFQTPELIEQASKAGVGAYLVKPPTAREIDRTITIAVARFEDMMELHRLNLRLQKEISRRHQMEQQLTASLEEKKLLLQEIHHRVKNNLMVISSLLNLQADGIENAQARDAFRESQHRVQAMARIHEQLYRSENLVKIDMGHYINTMGDSLRHTFGAYQVNLMVDAADVSLSIDAAIPCGLIINELLTNALKYAFPQKKTGYVWVKLESNAGDGLRLVVRDNGVGLPADFDPNKLQSLGLQLVDLLARQLNGAFEISAPQNGHGTSFTVVFRPY